MVLINPHTVMWFMYYWYYLEVSGHFYKPKTQYDLFMEEAGA